MIGRRQLLGAGETCGVFHNECGSCRTPALKITGMALKLCGVTVQSTEILMQLDSWSLVSLATPFEGRQIAALGRDGRITEIDFLPSRLSMLEFFERFSEFETALRAFDVGAARSLPGARITAPLKYPTKVVCVGANYSGHRKEAGIHDQSAVDPFLFLKPPSSTIIGDGDEIRIASEAENIDWEAEIAVIISKGGRNIRREDALDHIGGYTLVNDVSARGLFETTNPVHPSFSYDWLSVKGQDTFCPMGPSIVPAWFVGEYDDIDFTLHVNGELKQSGNTGLMITDIPGCIVAASRILSLQPGDVICTGTPQGVGLATGTYLKVGDEVVLHSPLIGTLRNRVAMLEAVASGARPIA